MRIVKILVETKKNSIFLCLLATILAGCSNQECTNPEGVDSTLISATVDKNDGMAILSILKGNAVVYKQAISDAPVIETRVENKSLDFNGDGQQEVVIYLWEGQNSGDRILVFGESDGKWSQWMDAYRTHFESKIVKLDNRDNIQVLDPDTGQMNNIYPDLGK